MRSEKSQISLDIGVKIKNQINSPMRNYLFFLTVPYSQLRVPSFPDMSIDGELSDYLQPISDRQIKNSGEGSLKLPRKVSFSRASGGSLKHYYINGEPYDPESQDYILELNTAEQWVLSNPSESSHPFHIHVNHFQIKGDLIDPDKEDMPSNLRL